MTETEHDQDLPLEEPAPEGEPDEDEQADDDEQAEAAPTDPAVEQADQPQAQHVSEVEWEKRNAKAEQRFNTYAAALSKIYEEDFNQLAPCPLCLGPVRGYVEIAAAGRVPDDQAQLVKHYLGLARPRALQPDPETSTCQTCLGEGKTETGSHVPTQTERTCPRCKGYGYTPPPSARQNGPVSDETGAPIGGPTSPDIPQEERDEWGEPLTLPDGRENPNYGRMPHRKILVQPWGITANLTAQDAITTGGS
jgi:hypothetical protein